MSRVFDEGWQAARKLFSLRYTKSVLFAEGYLEWWNLFFFPFFFFFLITRTHNLYIIIAVQIVSSRRKLDGKTLNPSFISETSSKSFEDNNILKEISNLSDQFACTYQHNSNNIPSEIRYTLLMVCNSLQGFLREQGDSNLCDEDLSPPWWVAFMTRN